MNKNKLIPELRFPEFKNKGEWEKKSFEDLLEIGNGRDYKHLDKGDIPVYGSGGYMLSVNDFLYDGESACIGRKGTIDKPMFLTGKFWTVDTLFYTHSFKDCLPKYIYYLFQNINWLKHNEAGGVPSLSKANIYKIQNLIPKIGEQKKITSCLSSLDELITAESQKLEVLKEHKKGLMQNLFPQEGETTPKLRFPEFKNDDESIIQKLDDKNIAEFINEKVTFKELQKKAYISTENMLPDYGGVVVSTKLPSTGSFTRFQKGDILVSNIRPYLRKVWFANISGATSNDVIVIRAGLKIENSYLSFYLKNDNFIDYVMKGVEGVKMPRGDKDRIKDYKIGFPKLREQQKIVTCLSALEEIIIAQGEKVKHLQLHKKGLMQGLFPYLND